MLSTLLVVVICFTYLYFITLRCESIDIQRVELIDLF